MAPGVGGRADDVAALAFHLDIVRAAPPRVIRLRPGATYRPLVLYTDAEFTPGELPRLGWVLFRDPPL